MVMTCGQEDHPGILGKCNAIKSCFSKRQTLDDDQVNNPIRIEIFTTSFNMPVWHTEFYYTHRYLKAISAILET